MRFFRQVRTQATHTPRCGPKYPVQDSLIEVVLIRFQVNSLYRLVIRIWIDSPAGSESVMQRCFVSTFPWILSRAGELRRQTQTEPETEPRTFRDATCSAEKEKTDTGWIIYKTIDFLHFLFGIGRVFSALRWFSWSPVKNCSDFVSVTVFQFITRMFFTPLRERYFAFCFVLLCVVWNQIKQNTFLALIRTG